MSELPEHWSRADREHVEHKVYMAKQWNDSYEKRGWGRPFPEDPQVVFDKMPDCIKTTGLKK